MVMRFTWAPNVGDTVIPFLIGLLEFSLIAATGPSSLGIWFATMGLIFTIVSWASYTIFRRASQDPANREFFDTFPPPSWRDLLAVVIPAGTLFGLALFFSMTGSRSIVALVAILTALGFIINRLWITRAWWNRAISSSQ